MLGRRVSEMRSEYIGYRGKIRIEFSKLPFRLFLVDETVTQTTPSDQASDVVVTNSLGDSSCTEVVPSDPASDVMIDTTAFQPQVPSCSASSVRAYSTCKTKLSKNADKKKANFCSFEIGKKQAHLEHLKKQVSQQKIKLVSMKSKQSHYSPRNVNKREMNLKRNLGKVKKEKEQMSSNLSQTIEHLKLENAKLMKDNERLQNEIDLHISKLRREQKLKSHFKSSAKKQSPVENNAGAHEDYVRYLENLVCKLEEKLVISNSASVATKEKGEYNQDVRNCVLELLGNEVALHKVAPVIQAVSKHLFKTPLSDLPRRQCVNNISDEAHFLVKKFYAEKLASTDHWGLNKDGTSRKKNKMVNVSLTLGEGETLSLGFKRVARETAQAIADNLKEELSELASVHQWGKDTSDSDASLVTFLRTLTFMMSDRAANEKLSNQIILEWVDECLDKTSNDRNKLVIHLFYCSAHVLLGFSTDTAKQLQHLQSELEKGSTPFGRKADGQFSRYSEPFCIPRVVRMTSELLGPNVDEKNGLRDKWLSFCREKGIRSVIGDYKDNRFNALFATSAQLVHQYSEILEFFDKNKEFVLNTTGKNTLNQKVKSVMLDLQDKRVVMFVRAIAVFHVLVTLPYWEYVQTGANYLELFEVVQPLYNSLSLWKDDASAMLEFNLEVEQCQPVYGLSLNTSDPIVRSVMLSPIEDKILLLRALACIAGAFHDVIGRQLVDFLQDGKYSTQPSETELLRTRNSHLHNLVCEHNFGDLDSSQKRRPNASMHFHSTIQMLKHHRIGLMKWLENKSDDEQCSLWKEAREGGKALRAKHKTQEARELAKEQDHFMHSAPRVVRKRKASKTKPVSKSLSSDTVQDMEVEPFHAHFVSETTDDTYKEGEWIAVAYTNGWYPGYVTHDSPEGDSVVEARFMHPTSIVGQYKYPRKDDIASIEKKFIFGRGFEPPVPRSGRGFELMHHYELEEDYNNYCESFF